MAKQAGIQLSVDIQYLLNKVNEAIDTLNNRGKYKKVKLSADENALATSIRKAIQNINADGQLKNKPVNIAANEAQLLKSIKTAINNINTNGSLNAKTVKLKANLNIDEAVKRVKSQIAGIASQSNGINIGQNINNPALDKAVANVRKKLQAEGEQLKTNNDFLRERVTLFTKSSNLVTSRKYGTTGEHTTINTLNGKITSITDVTDNSKIAAEQAKATAAINETRAAALKLRDTYTDINATKPIKNTENFNELERQFEEIIRLTNEFEKADSKNTEQYIVDSKAKRAELERFITLYQKAEYSPSTLRAKDVETLKAISANQFKEFVAQIKSSDVPFKQMEPTINSLKASLSQITNAGSLTKYLNELGIAKSEFSALKSEGKALTSELSKVDTVSNQIAGSLGKIASASNQGIFIKNSSSEKVIALQERFTKLTADYTALQTSLKDDTSSENLARVKNEAAALQKKLQEALTDSKGLKNSLANLKINSDITRKASVLLGQITEYERLNDKALGMSNPISGMTFGAELEQLKAAIPNVQDLGALDQLNNKFTILKSNIKAIGKEGNTNLTQIKNSAAKFVKWMSMTLLFTKARMYFNQLFTTVLSLDSALIDLKKTFKGSTEELNEFYFESNKLAKQMGVTTAEIIKQGAAFSRLGYSSNETMKKMAEMSAMFAAISPDMDTEAAQNGLVSIMKAFDIDPDNVLDGILSKVNIIGNTAATSNGEIVEMLQKSSAAMKVANNTLEEAIGLEIAAVEVTRDASSTGVAWKTISARLRGLDEETLEVFEDITELTGKFADFTKTAKTPGGISLFTDESKTTYKSTYQIIKELSEIWDDLTDVQTARIGEVIGGKRNLQVVAATIENFKAAENALDDMANSAGNAEAEMETIRQGAAYALNELQETFTALAQNSVSRGELKTLINTGTTLLELLNGLVKTFGGLPVAIGAASEAITAFKKNGEGLLGYNSKGNFTVWGAEAGDGFKSWIKEKTDPTGAKSEIKNQVNAVKEFNTAIKTNQMTLQAYNAVMKSSNDNVKRYGRAVMQGADQTQAFKTVNKQLKTELKQVGKNAKTAADGTKQLSVGMKALNVASSMLVSMGISALINVTITGITKLVNSYKDLNNELKELDSKYESINSEITHLNEQLVDTQTKITELEKLPKLSFLQKEELEELKRYNDELERQRKQREAEAEGNKVERYQKAQKLFDRCFIQALTHQMRC